MPDATGHAEQVRCGALAPTLERVPTAGEAGSSLTRALRVLEAVAAAGDGVTAKAIARRIGCPLPSVYRSLGTLVEQGYLVRLHGVRGYGIGYRVAQLQRGMLEQLSPPAGVLAVAREAHRAAGAACYVVVFRDDQVVLVHVDDCAEHRLPAAMRLGEPLAPHACAAGKVMLAALRPARLTEWLAHAGLPLLGPRTIGERRALDRELMRVRTDSAAIDVEEYQSGTAGVAAPIRGPGGALSGALGVSVTRTDFTARRWELERLVRLAAGRAGAVWDEAERPAAGLR